MTDTGNTVGGSIRKPTEAYRITAPKRPAEPTSRKVRHELIAARAVQICNKDPHMIFTAVLEALGELDRPESKPLTPGQRMAGHLILVVLALVVLALVIPLVAYFFNYVIVPLWHWGFRSWTP
jgi:hypothetical protein